MSQHHHEESHLLSGTIIRDFILGMSDGLTVPFALAAGLSGAVSTTIIIVTAGLAEIVAGSISMGVGGYLASKSEIDFYDNERLREQKEVIEIPHEEEREVRQVLETYGISATESKPFIEALKKRPESWVNFMMRFELGLEKPKPKQAIISAFTIGGAYIIGGLIPLFPYMLTPSPKKALMQSIAITLSTLLVFGYVKGKFLGTKPFKSAIQTLIIGTIAASAAYFIAKIIT